MVKTLKEAEDRIRKAMQPQVNNNGGGFAPAIQRLRQTARARKPMTRLPVAR